MTELLAPIHQLVDIPLAQLPTASSWQRLSPHWPALQDREVPEQWAAKVRLFQYLAKAWGAISDDSYRALCGDLRLFFDWCRARELPALPATPKTVATFLVDQAEIKAKSTVQRYLASIARAHKVAGLESPVTHEDVTLVYERHYRDDTSEPRQSEGLRWETLSDGLVNLGEGTRDVRDNALMRVMYDCLLRASEVRSLTFEGLSRDRNGYRLRVIRAKKRSKAQQGVVKTKFVHETTAAAIETWCALAGITQGAIFRGVSKSGLVLETPLSTKGSTEPSSGWPRPPVGIRGGSAGTPAGSAPARICWPPASISAGLCWRGTGSDPKCRPIMAGSWRRISLVLPNWLGCRSGMPRMKRYHSSIYSE